MAHGGRQRGGWTDQCTETDPGAVQPARDGRVRHGYPYRSDPQARSHAVRPLPQDGPRGLPHHVSREAAVFEVMLTRGYSGIRAGTFIIPIPGALASDETAPSVRSSAQRSSTTMSLPSRPLVWGTSRSKVTDAHRQPASSSRSISLPSAARQPTSRARVLEVRIQSPPAESPLRNSIWAKVALPMRLPPRLLGALLAGGHVRSPLEDRLEQATQSTPDRRCWVQPCRSPGLTTRRSRRSSSEQCF